MIYLLLTVLFAVLIYLSFKLIGILKLDAFQIIVVNYFVAMILGFSIWHQPLAPGLVINKPWFFISLIIAISFIVTFYLFALSSEKVGIAITAVSSKMSVLMPVIAGFILFNDGITILKILGILLALVSFLMVFRSKGSYKLSLGILVIPVLLFIGSGLNDTLTKYAQHHFIIEDEMLFLSTIFMFSFVISFIYLIITKSVKRELLSISNIIAGVILGLINFWSMYFLLEGLNIFEASIFFPIVNVSVVSITALLGFMVFKEKLSLLNWGGIIMAIISILLISSG